MTLDTQDHHERILRMVLSVYTPIEDVEPREVQWRAAKRHAGELLAASDCFAGRGLMAIADLVRPDKKLCCAAPDRGR